MVANNIIFLSFKDKVLILCKLVKLIKGFHSKKKYFHLKNIIIIIVQNLLKVNFKALRCYQGYNDNPYYEYVLIRNFFKIKYLLSNRMKKRKDKCIKIIQIPIQQYKFL